MYTQKKRNYNQGQALVEILITIGLAAILLPAILVGTIASRAGHAQQDQHLQAVSQIQQMQEAMRSIRESGWNAIATDGTYYPVISGTIWTLADGQQTTDGYTDKVVIGDVFRDTDGAIVATGGTLDPSTKTITSTVSWNTPYPSSIQSVTYLTRYLNNLAHTDTTVSDFSQGTFSGTTTTNTNGGEIVLTEDNGTYESATFDASSAAAFNNIYATVDQPDQTTIKAQVAVASAVDDSCNGVTFTYVGPNGDPSAYFTPISASISATLALGSYGATYENPGRCFRYKVFFTSTDITKTPILEDVSTNYSP